MATSCLGDLSFYIPFQSKLTHGQFVVSSFPIFSYKCFLTFPLLKYIMKATRLNSSTIGWHLPIFGTRIFLWMFPLYKGVAREKVTDHTGMDKTLGPLHPVTWVLQTKISRSPSVLDTTSTVAQTIPVCSSFPLHPCRWYCMWTPDWQTYSFPLQVSETARLQRYCPLLTTEMA